MATVIINNSQRRLDNLFRLKSSQLHTINQSNNKRFDIKRKGKKFHTIVNNRKNNSNNI